MSVRTKEYFPHDYGARTDPKLQKVLMTLGHEGKSVYWDLVEMLYEQGGYLLLSECESYAFALRTSCDCIAKLIHDYSLFQFNDTRFWSESILSRLNLRNTKSETAKKSAFRRWNSIDNKQDNANALQTQCEGNAIKVKESKEKERSKEVKKEKKERKEENTSLTVPVKVSSGDLHKSLIEIHSLWYLKTVGVKYLFKAGKDGAATKTLIANLGLLVNWKQTNGHEETPSEKIIKAWAFILDSHSRWSAFHQGQKELSQIVSNLNGIIATIKNGDKKYYSKDDALNQFINNATATITG